MREFIFQLIHLCNRALRIKHSNRLRKEFNSECCEKSNFLAKLLEAPNLPNSQSKSAFCIARREEYASFEQKSNSSLISSVECLSSLKWRGGKPAYLQTNIFEAGDFRCLVVQKKIQFRRLPRPML